MDKIYTASENNMKLDSHTQRDAQKDSEYINDNVESDEAE